MKNNRSARSIKSRDQISRKNTYMTFEDSFTGDNDSSTSSASELKRQKYKQKIKQKYLMQPPVTFKMQQAP